MRYTPAADEVAEADAVADAAGGLIRAGTPASKIAVLFRINAQSEAFEEALASRGLPYVVRGATRFFERPEVRQAVTLLRGAVRSDDESAPLLDLVRATLAGMGWTTEAPTTRGQTRDRWESLQALMTMAEEAGEMTRHRLRRRPRPPRRRAARAGSRRRSPWPRSTRRRASSGTPSSSRACTTVRCRSCTPTTDAEIEEERRLLYVGMTRAREHLVVSWAAARTPGGRGNRQPSRFLQSLLPAEARAASAKPKQRRAVHCRECGKPLSSAAEKKRGRCADCPASYDEELFERLRVWRKETADEESVPAFVVFTDATLAADRRAATHVSGGPAAHQRSGSGQARTVRRRPSRGRGLKLLKHFSRNAHKMVCRLRRHPGSVPVST